MVTKYSVRHAANFADAQAVASRRLGFTVTKACPLRCGHCSVSAGPDLGHTTLTGTFGQIVACQLSDLKDYGVHFIDFTGGEPTLAPDFIRQVSATAKTVDMSCSIVTAAHWAVDRSHALKFLQHFSNIDNWDVSTDIYHLKFVPLQKVETAFKVLKELNKTVLIRIAHHDPLTMEDAELIQQVYKFAGREIAFQPIGPVGRAAELFQYITATQENWDTAPCPSTGPLVRSTGLVEPCCAPLSNEDFDHPLRLGNAFEESLTTIIQKWRIHPLLQTIRVWGFKPVLKWLEEADEPWNRIVRHRNCHTCVELVRNRHLCEIAMSRATDMTHRIKLAYALKQYFDEPWMDIQLRKEASDLLTNTV